MLVDTACSRRYVSDETDPSPHDKKLAVLGHKVMLQMMLKDNFIHSDLHPGNIMVRLEPPANAVLQAVSQLSSRVRQWATGKCWHYICMCLRVADGQRHRGLLCVAA